MFDDQSISKFSFNRHKCTTRVQFILKNKKMKLLLALVLLLSVVSCSEKWAVLVAGSNTYGNYRHQADVFHAYQILKNNGFSKDRIITFAYDDIADNVRNPFKGKVFNKPTFTEPGVDVYEGVVIDYSGKDVMPINFLNVLEGNKTALKGIGSGRVLQSTAQDNVFLYFADHGAPGLIAFPSKYLYAKDLIATFGKMSGKFDKLVFYLESCESGSMFTNLANNTRIYALSAANPSESSWGTYCSPQDVIQGKHIGSCLGDLFSVNFLENTETSDLFSMTLNEQFDIIKKATTKSHVLQWGDQSYATDKVSEFLSNKSRFNLRARLPRLTALRRADRIHSEEGMVDSRQIKVTTLASVLARQETVETMQQFNDQVEQMSQFDYIFTKFGEAHQIHGKYDAYNINFQCLEAGIDHFESEFQKFSDYGLKYISYIAEACEKYDTDFIKGSLTAEVRSFRTAQIEQQ